MAADTGQMEYLPSRKRKQRTDDKGFEASSAAAMNSDVNKLGLSGLEVCQEIRGCRHMAQCASKEEEAAIN